MGTLTNGRTGVYVCVRTYGVIKYEYSPAAHSSPCGPFPAVPSLGLPRAALSTLSQSARLLAARRDNAEGSTGEYAHVRTYMLECCCILTHMLWVQVIGCYLLHLPCVLICMYIRTYLHLLHCVCVSCSDCKPQCVQR